MRAASALPPSATQAPGTERVARVAADATGRYVDGARFRSEADGRAAYTADLQLAAWLKSQLSDTATPERVAAVSDLLMAGRLAAEAAVQDAQAALGAPEPGDRQVVLTENEEASRTAKVEGGDDPLAEAPAVTTPGGREAALRELALAQRALERADKALGSALPVAALTHDGLAWRHGFHALVHLGITYDGDRDGDGVPDRLELMLGASPMRVDSDGDGLTDRFEIDALFGQSLPSKADTDADSIGDGAEDLDGDGLTAREEQDAGTSPTEPDTDSDGALDGAELAASTDPVRADTDADGLRDGLEPLAGTDARDPDSDDDGTLDGAEQLRQQVQGVDGIRAVLIGSGDLVSSFSVSRVTTDVRASGAGGQVGPAYDFSLSPPAAARMQAAELSVPYDPSTLGNASPADLRLFYLDPERGVWQPAAEQQVVDTTAHVVRATVPHFSTYAIFDIRNWGETWTAQDNPCRTRADSGTDVVLLDLALVLDSSGSMSWNDPSGMRRTAAKSFVDALLPADRAGVVDFDSYGPTLQGLTTDKTAVKAAIDRIDDWGGTNIAAGVRLGNDLLINNGDPARARMAILLTDGVGYYDPALTEQAKAQGITIYTIGLGYDVDDALLRGIAEQTGGVYHAAGDLPEVFRRIAEDSGGNADVAKDSDGDGLFDCTEIQGVLSGFQDRFTSDPNDEDTDDDGLTDAEEVGEKTSYADLGGLFSLFAPTLPTGLAVYDVQSDPRKADTDSDGLVDPAELDSETEAFRGDTDADGLSDGDEVQRVASAPLLSDTDGDSFSDGFEDAHRADQGLNPLFPDVKVSKWSYSTDFAKGAIAGDLWREDSLAWLAGNLASGASSFIPVVGWVVGGIADLRDAIGSAIHADWVGSGLSVVGVVPYAGDAVAIPGKAAKFVARNADKADEVTSFIVKLDDVPTGIKVDASKLIYKTDWDVLKQSGFSDSALLALEKGRGNLKDIAGAMGRAGHRAGVVAGTFPTGKAGEAFLENLFGATVKGQDKQVWASTKGFLGRGRFTDVVDANGIARESKVGYVSYSRSIINQIEKDAYLVNTGQINGAHWHFFISSASNTLGADRKVLDLLDAKGIPYTLHAA